MTPPRIDHIGIVVADLEAALASLAPLFGAPVLRRDLGDAGLRVAELKAANVTVELLEYVPGEASAFARGVMGTAPGLNHLSVHVDDLDAGLAAMSAAGFATMAGFPRQGAHGRIAFLAPDAASALRVELCQPQPQAQGGPDHGH